MYNMMNKQYQTSYASQGFPFRGNPKHVVIHSLEQTLANYNEASFSMAKNDVKLFCKNMAVLEYGKK
jgi:hypothetical protein